MRNIKPLKVKWRLSHLDCWALQLALAARRCHLNIAAGELCMHVTRSCDDYGTRGNTQASALFVLTAELDPPAYQIVLHFSGTLSLMI